MVVIILLLFLEKNSSYRQINKPPNGSSVCFLSARWTKQHQKIRRTAAVAFLESTIGKQDNKKPMEQQQHQKKRKENEKEWKWRDKKYATKYKN